LWQLRYKKSRQDWTYWRQQAMFDDSYTSQSPLAEKLVLSTNTLMMINHEFPFTSMAIP
jgi:hypothetical protein